MKSRKESVVLGAAPQMWEQHSKVGLIWDLYRMKRFSEEKYFRHLNKNRSFLEASLASAERNISCQIRLSAMLTPTNIKELFTEIGWLLMIVGCLEEHFLL